MVLLLQWRELSYYQNFHIIKNILKSKHTYVFFFFFWSRSHFIKPNTQQSTLSLL